MFDVGFSELLIIAVVALLVLGPERLPKAARFAGLWVRKARAQWYSVKSEFELELAQEEMKQHLQSVENSIKAPMQELQNDLQEAQNDINNGFVDADENETQNEAVTRGAEMDVLPEAAPAMPDGPVDEQSPEDGPDETNPKQGALW
jgi:sec-independent protein translocase protein TatB